MCEEASYYDSDDDVCWGTYSLQECKRDILRTRSKEDIRSRNTTSCDPRFLLDIGKRAESLIVPDEKATPSPSACIKESRNFIDKISQILEEDVILQDVVGDHENVELSDAMSPIWEANIDSSDSVEENVTQESFGHYETVEILTVNGKILPQNMEENDDVDESFVEHEVIEISETHNISVESEPASEYETYKYPPETDGTDVYFSAKSNVCDVKKNVNGLVSLDNTSFMISSIISDQSISNNKSSHLDNESEENKGIQAIADTTRNSTVHFNDTLEEIENLLKYGTDYELPKKPIHLPTPSFIPVPSKTYHSKSTFSNVLSPVAAYITSPRPKMDKEFKIPEKPLNIKYSPNPSKLRFRDIKSPVAAYIKNTPITPLFKTITPKKCTQPLLPEKTVRSLEKQNKENIEIEFPKIIYKPAKHVVNDVLNTKLPNNIECCLPNPTYVVKHVERIGASKNASISRRLLEEDLTIINTTSEDALLNSSQDISIRVTKRALI